MKRPALPHLPATTLARIRDSLLVILATYLLLLAFLPVNPITINHQPYRVVTREVKVGEPVVYETDTCKHTSDPATVTRQLAGERTIVSLPPVTTNFPPGCRKSLSATTVIPPGTPPGRYHLELTLTYRVNALRYERVQVETEPFEVVE